MDLAILNIITDFAFWMSTLGWLWLVILAFFFYNWVRDKLAYISPTLAIIVSALIIYFLVIEHPIIGSITFIGYILIFGGILYMLPLLMPFFRKKP